MTEKFIGQKIKERRKLLKVTQMDLSEIAGVSLRTIKAVEEGKGNPTIETVDRVLKPLGLLLTIRERINNE